VQQAAAQLAWYHFITLIEKEKNEGERLYFMLAIKRFALIIYD
tara:strand:- start:47119 stop:47247 length:129 start_codon:yes stop_codon:yes gene_type:complete